MIDEGVVGLAPPEYYFLLFLNGVPYCVCRMHQVSQSQSLFGPNIRTTDFYVCEQKWLYLFLMKPQVICVQSFLYIAKLQMEVK